jgi:hypothetical protein
MSMKINRAFASRRGTASPLAALLVATTSLITSASCSSGGGDAPTAQARGGQSATGGHGGQSTAAGAGGVEHGGGAGAGGALASGGTSGGRSTAGAGAGGAGAGTGGSFGGLGGAPGGAGAGGNQAGASAGGGMSGSPGSGAGGGGAGGAGGAAAGHGGGGAAGSSGAAGGAGAGGMHDCAGNALSLAPNGTGSASDAAKARVVVDLMSDLPAGNSHRTVEFWAYIRSTDWVGNTNTLYFYGSTARPAHGFGLDFGTSAAAGMTGSHATLDPFTNGGYDADTTTYVGVSSSMDQWVHLAMTWDGSAVRTLVNGTERITKMGDSGSTALATDQSAITIGGYEQESAFFGGMIDEFRVWNTNRSATEIASTMGQSLAGDEPGLVLYLKFDETSGTAAADAVATAGHTQHAGVLMSANNQLPTFVKSTAPIACPAPTQ